MYLHTQSFNLKLTIPGNYKTLTKKADKHQAFYFLLSLLNRIETIKRLIFSIVMNSTRIHVC